MSLPYDVPSGDKSFWHGVRCDETLRVLWSLGRGYAVSIGPLAKYLDMNVEAAIDWMENNGKGLWEPDDNGAWLPLTGKHRRKVGLTAG